MVADETLLFKFIDKLFDYWVADLDNLCDTAIGWTGWKVLLPEVEKCINHFSLFLHAVRVPPVVKTSIEVFLGCLCKLSF